jgi:hypothetical protein
MDEEVDNVHQIAQAIFSKPPGPPKSVQLQLEELTSHIAEEEGVEKFICNILCILTITGIQILYGHKNILLLTSAQYDELCDYVQSYGYTLEVYANDTMFTPWELLNRGVQLRTYKIGFEALL